MEPFINDNVINKGPAHGRAILKKLVRDSIKEIEIQRQTLNDEDSDLEEQDDVQVSGTKQAQADRNRNNEPEEGHTVDIGDAKTFRVENIPSGQEKMQGQQEEEPEFMKYFKKQNTPNAN